MITMCTTDMDTVHSPVTLLVHSICKTGCNTITEKKVRIIDRYNKIIVAHNFETYTWLNHYNV
jgi:hypothetical protein